VIGDVLLVKNGATRTKLSKSHFKNYFLDVLKVPFCQTDQFSNDFLFKGQFKNGLADGKCQIVSY
jgi:hypothetical protein